VKVPGFRVCVVGLWHLGCVYSGCLARLGYRVIGTDEDTRIIEKLKEGKPPIFEPGLDNLVAEGMAHGSLDFVEDIERGALDADYVVIAYDTPVDAEDRVDLSPIFRAANRLKIATRHATFVVSSQVPVGTCEQIAMMLSDGGIAPDLAYVPENLRLGEAIERFMKPEMIVIGANSPSTISKVQALFAPINTKVIQMDLRSAEMAKHALNAFLATSISFANEVGNICDLVGADALNVAKALRSDSRIGQKALLRPGLGFAGGTLARDLRILQEAGKMHGYETILLDSVLDVNQRQNASIVNRLKLLVGELGGKSVAVLGLTYKSGTSTLRRSAALEIISRLQQEGAAVKAFDPQVSRSDVAGETFLLCDDPYEVCENADILVVLNDWPGFVDLDFKRIRGIMRVPTMLDTQNLLDPSKVAESGIRCIGMGRGTLVAREDETTDHTRH